MKRILYLFLVLAMLLCGCGRSQAEPQKEEALSPLEEGLVSSDIVPLPQGPAFDYENYDWAALLLGDAFTTGTPIGDAAIAQVKLQIDAVTDSTLSLTITAPYIADTLWDWYATQAPDNAAVEAKTLSLLAETAPTTKSFTLSYRVGSDGIPKADYTAAYGSCISCGLTDFYHRLQREFLTELEGSVYG